MAHLMQKNPTPEEWLFLVQSHSEALGLSWLDLIVDQAGLGSAWQSRIDALCPPKMLLNDTPHADAAEEGPVLVRVSHEHTGSGLLKLLHRWHGQPRVLALLSPWLFEDLASNCTFCLQASWDKGLQKGVLRYHDPRLFGAVVDTLDDVGRGLLLRSARQWHWLDRDGHARLLDAEQWHTPSPQQWPDEALSLKSAQVDTLASWHIAELWRQNHLLIPDEYNLASEEELITQLAHAHQAADKANVWSESERLPFVDAILKDTRA